MQITSLADLQAVARLKVDPVLLGDGSTVIVRELSLQQRDEFISRAHGAKNVSAFIVSEAAVDAEGRQIFAGQEGELATLISPTTLETIARRALALSGLLPSESTAPKA